MPVERVESTTLQLISGFVKRSFNALGWNFPCGCNVIYVVYCIVNLSFTDKAPYVHK